MRLVTVEMLQTFWERIKEIFVAKEKGKGLSTNDFTDTQKGHYDAAYVHSTTEHAPANARENIIEAIKVNGTTLKPSEDKAVDIKVEDIELKDYLKKEDIVEITVEEIDELFGGNSNGY